MTIPAKYTLTEAHMKIAELEQRLYERNHATKVHERIVAAEAERDKALESRALNSQMRAKELMAAEAEVKLLRAVLTEARDWINEDEVAEPWPPMMERIDAALAAPTKEEA